MTVQSVCNLHPPLILDLFLLFSQCGKCVPVILPPEVLPVLEYLSRPSVRREAGINSGNIYLFASNSKSRIITFECILQFE
jgi:hypothetical protein